VFFYILIELVQKNVYAHISPFANLQDAHEAAQKTKQKSFKDINGLEHRSCKNSLNLILLFLHYLYHDDLHSEEWAADPGTESH
jgi:hypothetical protein